MAKNINEILKGVLNSIRLKDNEVKSIDNSLKDFTDKIGKSIKKSRLNVEVFVGGSFAKKTMIKKGNYDVDIFLRFDKKYSENISRLAENLLKGLKKEKIHGSRDYFRVGSGENVLFEIIPVIRIKKPEEARNITDLSFFHVNYVKKFPKKLFDEIIIAKAFCHANNCYGAESYIRGFSGYALELLVYHYGGFLKFVKAMTKINVKEKTVIDVGKKFKNKNEVLMDINSAKLQSPIVLVDPTYRQRNALAALSTETLKKFQKACKSFLKNPNIRFFEKKDIDFERMKKESKKRGFDFVLVKAKTEKQPGDIAGSKLLKFHNYLSKEIEKYFYIKGKEFSYQKGSLAIYAFSAKSRKEIIHKGPSVNDKNNVQKFKKRHKNVFVKSQRVYSKEKVKSDVKEFVSDWKRKNKDRLKEMHIIGLEVV